MAMRQRIGKPTEAARTLRAQGLSLRAIAERLGCTKQYVHKLLKQSEQDNPAPPAPSTERASTEVYGLTVRQRLFAKGLLEGKTQKEAALEATIDRPVTEGSAEHWASRTVRNPNFRNAFERMLSRAGLSEERLAMIHAENLGATKVVGWVRREDGTVEPVERPDYSVRQRAVDSGWDLYGRRKIGPEPNADAPTIILTLESARNIRRLNGGRFPSEEALREAEERGQTTLRVGPKPE